MPLKFEQVLSLEITIGEVIGSRKEQEQSQKVPLRKLKLKKMREESPDPK